MSKKRADVVIYSNVRIKVCGAEGETLSEVISNAQDAIDERVADDIKTVYVDPLSPTAKNLMGEVSYVELDPDGFFRYTVIERDNEAGEKEWRFQDHPLGCGPTLVPENSADLNTQAFELLKTLVDWEDSGESINALSNGQFAEWIEQARKLIQTPEQTKESV